MKYLLIFLFSFNVFAGDWEVQQRADEFVIKSPEGIFYSVQTIGGKPKFLFEKSLNKDLLQVVYFAGAAGTSQIIRQERALIFRKSDKKFVGDAPFRYGVSEGTTYKPAQPEWKITGQVIEVKDSETSKTYRFEL